MNRDTSPHRVTSNSRFGPSLEWDALPELGERDRHAYRASVWRWIIAGNIGFWGTILWALPRWIGS